MIEEKILQPLYGLIDESIERDLSQKEDFILPRFRGYLKQDVSKIYSLVDKNVSVKCIFNQDYLKDYMAGLPSYISFDDLDNCPIILKKYKFDYLLFKSSETDISFKIVCYIDTFDLSPSERGAFELIPDNINLNPEITQKAQNVVHNFMKKFIGDLMINNAPAQITAKNFITKAFNRGGAEISFFDQLQKERKTAKEMVLLKTNDTADSIGYIIDTFDSKILFQLKQLDWKELFGQTPTAKIREKIEEFLIMNSEKPPSKVEKFNFLNPSQLTLNVDISKQAVETFLLRKVKRQRSEKLAPDEKLPESISELMNSYGDVCANIGSRTVDKYHLFKRYSQIFLN